MLPIDHLPVKVAVKGSHGGGTKASQGSQGSQGSQPSLKSDKADSTFGPKGDVIVQAKKGRKSFAVGDQVLYRGFA